MVLPEYQGLGIGRTLTDEVAKIYLSNGKRFRETTSHAARIQSHKKNKNWICCSAKRIIHGTRSTKSGASKSENRLTATWEFVGEK